MTRSPSSTLWLAAVSSSLFLAVTAAPVEAGNTRWREVVGILSGGAVVGSGSGQVMGAPGPWSATNGRAQVDLDGGHVTFRVRGLVLAASNGIGTAGPVTQVVGTLVCDTDGSAAAGNSTLIDTPSVPLSLQGDASFDGPLGALPTACTDEPDIAFLVRASFNGVWIANGAVRTP